MEENKGENVKREEGCGGARRRKYSENCKGHEQRVKHMDLFKTTLLAILTASSLLLEAERKELFMLVEDMKNNQEEEIRNKKVFNVRRGGGQSEMLSLKDIEEEFKKTLKLNESLVIPVAYHPPSNAPLHKTLKDLEEEVKERYQEFFKEELEKEKGKFKKGLNAKQEVQAEKAANKKAAERMGKFRPYKVLQAALGDEAEVKIEKCLKEALGNRPGLVLRGIKTFQHLMKDDNKTLKKLGLHLSQSTSAGHETEHDILLVVPDGDTLAVTFVQVKRYTVSPWEKDQERGDKSQVDRNRALGGLVKEQLKQLNKDMKTFVELNRDLNMAKVELRLVSGLPFTTGDDVMCDKCLSAAIVKEDLEGDDWIEKVREKVNISAEATQPTDEVWNMYVQVSSRYGGLLSLVPLKTLGEGLEAIGGAMEEINKEYTSVFMKDSEDQQFIKLNQPQLDAVHGHLDSTILTGPFGSGKTLVSKLLVQKFVNEMKNKDTLVIMTAFTGDKILDEFRALAKENKSDTVQVDVRGWFELLDKYNVKETDDRLSTINELITAIKSAHPNVEILLFVDELEQDAVLDRDDYDRNSYDWSALVLEVSITLLLCFRPVAGSNRGSAGDRIVYPQVRRVQLDRIFRCTNAIQDFLTAFNSFLPDGVGDVRSVYGGSSGNSVPGLKPSWYHVPNNINSEEGGVEFNKVMGGVCQELTGDVTIIAGGATDEESSALAETIRKLTAGAHRVVEKFEFFGCEAQSIIVVLPLAAGLHQDLMSRAVANLVIITHSTGDQGEYAQRCWGRDLVTVLGKVVEEGKLDRKDQHQGAEYRSQDPGPVTLEAGRLFIEKGFTSQGLVQLRKTSPQEHAKVTRPIWAEARSNVEAKEFKKLIQDIGFTEESFGALQLEDPDRHKVIKDSLMKEVKDKLAPKVTAKQDDAWSSGARRGFILAAVIAGLATVVTAWRRWR